METEKCPYFGGVEEKAGKFNVKCTGRFTFVFSELDSYREHSKKCVGGQQENCKPFLCRQLEEMDVHLQWSEYGVEELLQIYNQRIIEEANVMEQHTDLSTTMVEELSERHAEAMELHERIREDVRIIAHSLSEMGRKLKKMRDKKLYTELGHKTFAEYGKAMLGLEQRQLYSYIQIYETYGPRFIDEHAEFGISKLLLLTNVPVMEREEFIEKNDVEELTVRQLKEMTEKYNHAAEQLYLLGEQKESIEEIAESGSKENEALLAKIKEKENEANELAEMLDAERKKYKQAESKMLSQIKEMDNRPIEVAVQEPDETVLNKIREEEAQKAKKAAAAEIKEAKEKVKSSADKKIKELEEKAKEQIEQAKKESNERAEQEIKNGLTEIQREKSEALARAANLEKKLSIAANNEIIKLNTLFEQMQELAEKVGSCIREVAEEDATKAEKLRSAANNIIESLKERWDT